MQFHKRLTLSVLFFASLFTSCAQTPSVSREILWDTYGVPHVYGKSLPDMYYGFGWAQMHNHANLLLRLYAQARGRSAEIGGKQFLVLDQLIHLLEIPELGKQQYAQQPPEFKPCIDSFVSGINAYAKAHPEAIDPELKSVLPITGPDVIAHTLRTLYLQFLAVDDIDVALQPDEQPGSNAVAIGPSRSADGNAMLLANPHLPWADLYLFFEAQLNGPGFNAYGVTLVGTPALAIAFNEHLGWTHTVNTIDAVDVYRLKTSGDNYILDGVPVPFTTKQVKIKVKQEDGTLSEETITFKYTQHGPVLGPDSLHRNAIRIAGIKDHPNTIYQWHSMAAAQNWKQFEAALKMMQLPMFNVMYADDQKNIAYLFAGNVPIRKEGDWNFWQDKIDGSQSKYIWAQTHPYQDLPKLLNPGTGFLQNANDPPWSNTWPEILNPAQYPPYMASRRVGMRPQRALHMILGDSSITYDELVAYKHSTHMEAADRFLDELLSASYYSAHPLVHLADSVLRRWDRCADADSRGAVLFTRWLNKLGEEDFRVPWNEAQPITTPAGLKDTAIALKKLAKATAEVLLQYHSVDVAWGDVYRFISNDKNYPGNGGTGEYGIFRVIEYRKASDNKYMAAGGDSYVAVVDFSKPLKAQVLLSYGNASQPGTKHKEDQMEFLAKKQLRTPWLQQKEILQHLEERETP